VRRVAAKGGLTLAGLLLLASCATVPERPPAEWLGVLPGDATLYASLSVPGSAGLIRKALAEAGPGSQDISTLLDMTKRLVCSATITPGAPAVFSVAALGSYPSAIIGLRLAGNKEWKRGSSAAGAWWEWSRTGIQMGIPAGGILLASNGDIEPLLARWKSPPALAVPPDVAEDMRSADLVVYMPELPGGFGQKAAKNGLRVPVNEVWLKAVRGDAAYTITGTANTASEREAKVLALALRIGLVAWLKSEKVPNTSELLKSISLNASGLQVKMTGLTLPDERIIPLFLSLVKGLSPEEPGAAPAQEGDVPAEAPADAGAAGAPG
jgi:hypothetical protein